MCLLAETAANRVQEQEKALRALIGQQVRNEAANWSTQSWLNACMTNKQAKSSEYKHWKTALSFTDCWEKRLALANNTSQTPGFCFFLWTPTRSTIQPHVCLCFDNTRTGPLRSFLTLPLSHALLDFGIKCNLKSLWCFRKA